MTNADKLLKVSVEEFINEFENFYRPNFCADTIQAYEDSEEDFENFLSAECKPTLTEDERVILRNIDKRYTRIGRYKENDFKGENEDNNFVGQLYVGQSKYGINIPLNNVFWGVFQFIKERRRIRY